MSLPRQITGFVHDALERGRSPAEIDAALASTGWSARERADALASWIAAPGMPPIPRPRPYLSAREALLYGLLFISLAVVAFQLCQLGFGLVDNLVLPAGGIEGQTRRELNGPIATLIIFTPVFLLLNRIISRGPERELGRRSLVRQWYASITLLITSVVLLSDLVAAVYMLLGGEMTLRFLIKALIVAAVAGLVIGYYRDEMHD
ncbi:DUF5671 domain-containing protein [Paracoccus xiamenensis]|uniref:DUF5671 domain-containing protein n=1 Tax=Paracoccus xiamenensis TaxID=2714901 RepID=UPI00140C35B9|nr:DUF5671 domain-containing protein [Paracoccus xiamenensis]NHF72137.1 hypothetical protein [Paracoccus xiamenensis]